MGTLTRLADLLSSAAKNVLALNCAHLHNLAVGLSGREQQVCWVWYSITMEGCRGNQVPVSISSPTSLMRASLASWTSSLGCPRVLLLAAWSRPCVVLQLRQPSPGHIITASPFFFSRGLNLALPSHNGGLEQIP